MSKSETEAPSQQGGKKEKKGKGVRNMNRACTMIGTERKKKGNPEKERRDGAAYLYLTEAHRLATGEECSSSCGWWDGGGRLRVGR